LLIVNRDEALQLATVLHKTKVQNNPKALFKILAQGQALTAITDGPRGAYLYDGSKIIFQKALDRKPVNTTGAGDCFGSSLVAGIIRYNGDLSRAMRLAIINSNTVIMKIGAQVGLLTARDLKKYHL